MKMVMVRRMRENQCPELLCAMLNFVVSNGCFEYESFKLFIREDDLPQIIANGVLRNKYTEVTKLHLELLDVKHNSV